MGGQNVRPFVVHPACMPSHGAHRALPPNQREGNHKARASPVTERSGGSRRGELVYNVNKPDSASYVGNLAQSRKAQRLDNIVGDSVCIQFKTGIT